MSRERDEGLEVAYDELSLSYEEFGSVGMPLLFVHGLGCDRTDFSYQIERFGRERRVVAVDLRGHGQSIRPEGDYSVPTFADDLARLCSELELERPAIVGHGMGSQVEGDLAARYPGLPGAVVMLDSTVLPPRRFTEFLRPFSAAMPTPGYKEALRRFFKYAFAPADNPGRKERLSSASPSYPSTWRSHHGRAFSRPGTARLPRRGVRSRSSTSTTVLPIATWSAFASCARNCSTVRRSAPGTGQCWRCPSRSTP